MVLEFLVCVCVHISIYLFVHLSIYVCIHFWVSLQNDGFPYGFPKHPQCYLSLLLTCSPPAWPSLLLFSQWHTPPHTHTFPISPSQPLCSAALLSRVLLPTSSKSPFLLLWLLRLLQIDPSSKNEELWTVNGCWGMESHFFSDDTLNSQIFSPQLQKQLLKNRMWISGLGSTGDTGGREEAVEMV